MQRFQRQDFPSGAAPWSLPAQILALTESPASSGGVTRAMFRARWGSFGFFFRPGSFSGH